MTMQKERQEAVVGACDTEESRPHPSSCPSVVEAAWRGREELERKPGQQTTPAIGPPSLLEDMSQRGYLMQPRPRVGGLVCLKCGERSYVKRECGQGYPTRNTAWTQDQVPVPKLLTKTIRVDGKEETALIDSGYTQTLVKKGWVDTNQRGSEVWIWCVHRDIKGYPTGQVTLEIRGLRKKVRVGIMERLQYDVILGRDWPAFKQLVREEDKQECMEGDEDPNLSQEQRSNPTLKRAWEMG